MKLRAIFGLILILSPLVCLAAGLGDIEVKSSLNQQLNAVIPVIALGNIPDGAVTASLASEAEFESVGLKRSFDLSDLAFTVEQNKQQQFYIAVSSSHPIEKPVVTFLLKLTWPNGKVLREYTLFLDPANYNTASNQVVATASPMQSSRSVKPMLPVSKTYGPTTIQDNLWTIAQRIIQGLHSSIDQVMVAILKLNPDAFSQNNINGLKAGYTLTLPNAAEANAISASKARQIISVQNTEWQTFTQTTVLPSPQSSSALPADEPQNQAQLPASKPITVRSLNYPSSLSPPTDENESDVSFTTPQNNALGNQAALNTNSSNAKLDSLENEVAVSSAAMKAAVGANQSLQMEITDLRTQLGALQKQLEEKDRTIATLQKELSVQAGTLLPPPNQQATGNNLPATAATKTTSYYWLVFLVLLLSSIATGLFLFRKRNLETPLSDYWDKLKQQLQSVTAAKIKPEKAKDFAEMDMPVVDAIENTVIYPAAKISPDPFVLTEATSHTTTMLDIVDEADVYIAYGRYEKAETLLRNSLKLNSDQPELRLKLLEIYLAKKDKVTFDKELEMLGELLELPSMFQAKLTKLFEAWKNIDLARDTLAEKAPSSPPSEPLPTATNTTTAVSPSINRDRLMEFDGDLSGLYSSAPEKQTEPPIASLSRSDDNADLLPISEDSLALEPDELPQYGTPNITNENLSQPLLTENKPILTTEEPEQTPQEAQETHLGLASTYIDMGDTEEAFLLLNAVLQKGNDEQKKEAQELIDRINQQKKI